MQSEYQKIIDYTLESGKRIKEKAGRIADIGVKKQYLTEEDIAIERGFADLINTFDGDHVVFAEEENFDFQEQDNIWVIDPISATASFIAGLPHYAIVCSHLHKGEVVFAAVYDPSVDEMFTAIKGQGAFLNGKKITFNIESTEPIIFNLSREWRNKPEAKHIWGELYDQNVYRNTNSFAVNYCWVAAGRFAGVLALTKDSFPEFAGKLMIEEAGGTFTNDRQEENIKHIDRIFVGGTPEISNKLMEVLRNTINASKIKISKQLVPNDFKIPEILETEKFRLRMLTVNDVEKDYEAVMSSVASLQGVFDDHFWPSPDLTLEQDLIDLGWHQKEFQRRSSFAYTVMSLDESKCLGCVYIYPTETPGHDAKVYLWVIDSELENGLDFELFETAKKWINSSWPFIKVEYPGRG